MVPLGHTYLPANGISIGSSVFAELTSVLQYTSTPAHTRTHARTHAHTHNLLLLTIHVSDETVCTICTTHWHFVLSIHMLTSWTRYLLVRRWLVRCMWVDEVRKLIVYIREKKHFVGIFFFEIVWCRSYSKRNTDNFLTHCWAVPCFQETVAVWFSCTRPVRETVAAAKRKARQEEEIVGQEMHAEPVFQRVFYVRSSVRTNSGWLRAETVAVSVYIYTTLFHQHMW